MGFSQRHFGVYMCKWNPQNVSSIVIYIIIVIISNNRLYMNTYSTLSGIPFRVLKFFLLFSFSGYNFLDKVKVNISEKKERNFLEKVNISEKKEK